MANSGALGSSAMARYCVMVSEEAAVCDRLPAVAVTVTV
jgi:hypothetical protein